MVFFFRVLDLDPHLLHGADLLSSIVAPDLHLRRCARAVIYDVQMLSYLLILELSLAHGPGSQTSMNSYSNSLSASPDHPKRRFSWSH